MLLYKSKRQPSSNNFVLFCYITSISVKITLVSIYQCPLENFILLSLHLLQNIYFLVLMYISMPTFQSTKQLLSRRILTIYWYVSWRTAELAFSIKYANYVQLCTRQTPKCVWFTTISTMYFMGKASGEKNLKETISWLSFLLNPKHLSLDQQHQRHAHLDCLLAGLTRLLQKQFNSKYTTQCKQFLLIPC